jgi:UDP-N-acetylmuramoyl-L-alanyl-D-glutamate--2,6-diaminopimelate ligase
MVLKLVKKIRNLKIISLVRKLIPHWTVNTFYHFPKALLAVLWYRYPAKDLKVIGVTGTDGKTTTSTLIYEILKQADFKVGLISTVSAKIGEKELSTGLHTTSPDPFSLQKILRQMVKKGLKYVVLEATSHGLAQHRLLGINFHVGVLTNISHEHLDYHKTMENYMTDKARLFKHTRFSILNKEDDSFEKIKKITSGVVVSYGFENADYTPENFSLKPSLLGRFNLLNSLAAAAAAKTFQIDKKIIKKTVKNFKGIVGRMQEINMGQDFKVFVDFAHTVNGLSQALKTLKKLPHKKLIAVFGCAGLRDFAKRPLMGRVACQHADKVVLTAEDPRTEDLAEIISQIKKGCKNKKKVLKEHDRQKAIDLAIIKLAEKGDIVGVFGKGHERSLCIGTTEYPWSDQKAVKRSLQKRLKTKRKLKK